MGSKEKRMNSIMEDPKNDFVVNSKGHCFFCLSKIPFKATSVKFKSSKNPEKGPSSLSPYSLHTVQCLSQYLKLDMTRVFSHKSSIPPSLLNKVKQSRLKVELCEECASMTKMFSVLFQQWEKIEMEMQSQLSHFQEKLTTTAQNLEGFVKSAEDEGIEEVLKVLRMETLEKCSSRTENRSPRIKIQKLTKKVMKSLSTRKSKNKSSETILKDSAVMVQAEEDVKVETNSQNEDALMDDGGDSGNAFLDDDMAGISDDDSMEQTVTINTITAKDASGSVNKEDRNHANDNAAPPLTMANIEQNCSINPVTGKYKCNLCSREFGKAGFNFHYKNVHLKIRYKCSLCGKLYSRQTSYNEHRRIAHWGVTYKCKVCNQEFKYSSMLYSHQRKNTCQAGDK